MRFSSKSILIGKCLGCARENRCSCARENKSLVHADDDDDDDGDGDGDDDDDDDDDDVASDF